MRLSNPLEALSSSLYSAAFVDLPQVVYETVDFQAMAGWTSQQRAEAHTQEQAGGPGRPRRLVERRPQADECEVKAMFPQLWNSTGLGFGGLGGAAMTPAYTVVVEGPGGDVAVYWSGRFAYLVPATGVSDEQRAAFKQDLARGWTVRRSEAEDRYGASVPGRPSRG